MAIDWWPPSAFRGQTHSSLSCGVPQLDHFIKERWGESLLQDGSHSRIPHNHGSDIHHPCHILLIKSKSQVCSHLREGNPTRACPPGGGERGDHLQSLSATMCKIYLCCERVYHYRIIWSSGMLCWDDLLKCCKAGCTLQQAKSESYSAEKNCISQGVNF